MVYSSTLPPVLPTLSQLKTLSQNIPPTPPPTPSLSSLLSPLLHHIKTPWHRTFLFTPDPIHIPHLTTPTDPYVCSLSATRTEALPTLPTPETHHLRNRYLFTPAFTLDTLTAGFGVMHTHYHVASSSTPVWEHACSKSLLFRFLRDTSSHTAIEVYSAPEHNVTLIFHTKFLSTTTSSTTTYLFHHTHLQSLISSPQTPTPKTLLPALLFTQHEFQSHICKQCSRPPTANCNCSLPTLRARHPFDNSHLPRAMQLHLGEYLSIAQKRFYFSGIPAPPIILAARVALSPIQDPDFVRDAAAWAISAALNNIPQQPRRDSVLQLCLPSFEEDELEPPDLVEELLCIDERHSPALSQLPVVSDVSNAAEDNVETFSVQPPFTPAENWPDCETEPRSSERASEESRSGTCDVAGSEGDVERERVLLERRMRAQARRERNRVAARKSNLRRKMVRDGLVADLESARGRVNVLRGREVLLRRENLRLRKLVGDISG